MLSSPLPKKEPGKSCGHQMPITLYEKGQKIEISFFKRKKIFNDFIRRGYETGCTYAKDI
jgi:hypothetical protein